MTTHSSAERISREAIVRFIPWFLLALFSAYLLYSIPLPQIRRSDDGRAGADVVGFASLPALHNGRVKPLDTIARVSLLMIRGTQTVAVIRSNVDGKGNASRTLSSIEWLLDVMARPDLADTYKIFVINGPDVLGLLGKQQEQDRYYSMKDLEFFVETIRTQAEQVEKIDSKARTRFQAAVYNLWERLVLYRRLRESLQISGIDDFSQEIETYRSILVPGIHAVIAQQKSLPHDKHALQAIAVFFDRYKFMAQAAVFRPLPSAPKVAEDKAIRRTTFAMPPLEGGNWMNIGEGLMEIMRTGSPHPGIAPYARMIGAWRRANAADFNSALTEYRGWLDRTVPSVARSSNYELRFNHIEPFYRGMILYVAIFLLAVASWLVWPAERLWPGMLGRSAFYLLILAFGVHTMGLVSRIVLQGRPPVTNLYSSAVFVGWIAVLLGLIVEKISRKGFGSAVASLVGFSTLLIAHHLAASGDTMEMMRAVLDSNFWLATHVVTITVGYGATFLAGALACVYILRGVLTRSLYRETARSLTSMAYGIICFALLFSFIGTILGGIWADQSWGRFWGWDPKENGALLIVLWNAIILHARWGGFVRERGLMVLAVFGNIVTSLSWFGVNMLGIGLHSYGWMDQAFYWLAFFVLTQLTIIFVGLLPFPYWKSRP